MTRTRYNFSVSHERVSRGINNAVRSSRERLASRRFRGRRLLEDRRKNQETRCNFSPDVPTEHEGISARRHNEGHRLEVDPLGRLATEWNTLIAVVNDAIVLYCLRRVALNFLFSQPPFFMFVSLIFSLVTYLLSSVTNLRVLHSILRPKLCTTGSALSPARIFANCGRKSNAKVTVVDDRIRAVMVTKANVARSGIRLANTTTIHDVITTRYTLMPMYCESFRAGILTCL